MPESCPTRIGHGFDLHRLEPNRELIICGQRIPHDCGADAHSDGDVVYHAVTDAILGALGQEDIGRLFPDDDPKWQGANSSIFVHEAVQRMTNARYMIGNIDVTVILQTPKLGPWASAMRSTLAELLGCDGCRVNIKAKTHERVDALGKNRAIACHVVVLLMSVLP